MKQTLLTLCLCAAFAPSAFAQQSSNSTNPIQNWSDTTRFVEGQQSTGLQASSPALRMPGSVGTMNPAQIQQMQQIEQQRIAAQSQGASGQMGQGQTPTEQTEQPAQNASQEAANDKPPVEDLTAQRLMWATDSVQNLRQEGGRMERPNARGFSSSTQSADRLRMAEWKRHLLNLGLPESKIDFEARRLNREEFELWASKLVWWESGEHPNLIDITH